MDIESIVDDILTHHGTKGMRWGVRKAPQTKPELHGLVAKPMVVKTKKGDELSLVPMKVNAIHRGMAKISSKYRENYQSSAVLSIKDKNGKKVGNGQMWLRGKQKEELYLNWIDVSKDSRGKGYASAILLAAESKAKEVGAKKMTLEVPGISPDARHIYEKQGFRVTKEPKSIDPMWGGLTTMEKEVK